MIFGRIVAGGEIDGAIDLAAANLAGHGGRRRGAGAEQRVDAARGEFDGSGAREFLGKETRVMGHQQAWARVAARVAAQNMFGDGGDGQAHVGKGKFVGNDSAPAGGAKLDGRAAIGFGRAVLYLARRCTPEKRGERKQKVKRRAAESEMPKTRAEKYVVVLVDLRFPGGGASGSRGTSSRGAWRPARI